MSFDLSSFDDGFDLIHLYDFYGQDVSKKENLDGIGNIFSFFKELSKLKDSIETLEKMDPKFFEIFFSIYARDFKFTKEQAVDILLICNMFFQPKAIDALRKGLSFVTIDDMQLTIEKFKKVLPDSEEIEGILRAVETVKSNKKLLSMSGELLERYIKLSESIDPRTQEKVIKELLIQSGVFSDGGGKKNGTPQRKPSIFSPGGTFEKAISFDDEKVERIITTLVDMRGKAADLENTLQND